MEKKKKKLKKISVNFDTRNRIWKVVYIGKINENDVMYVYKSNDDTFQGIVQWHTYCSRIETNFTICCLASNKLAELFLYTPKNDSFFVARSRGKDDGDNRQTLWNDFTRKLWFRIGHEITAFVSLFAGIRTILLRIPNPSCPILYRFKSFTPFHAFPSLHIPFKFFFLLFFFASALIHQNKNSIHFFLFFSNDSREQKLLQLNIHRRIVDSNYLCTLLLRIRRKLRRIAYFNATYDFSSIDRN